MRVKQIGESAMRVRQLGEFIRTQRRGAQMSLRGLSSVAGVSLPYLSQIERGLRRPSAEIMQAIARALRVSAQTLYVQAGILDEQPHPDVHEAVMGDPGLTERQKQALLSVYDSFRVETERLRGKTDEPSPAKRAKSSTKATPKSSLKGSTPRGTAKTSAPGARRAGTRKPASGRAETQAVPKPSPGSPPSSRSQSSAARRTPTTPKGGTR